MRYAELLEIQPKLAEYATAVPPELEDRFHLRRYSRHSLIQSKNRQLDAIGILLQGQFRVINEFENGNVFMIETNDPVSFVGEVTLLADSATTSVSIECVSECLIAYMSLSDFDHWLTADPHFLRLVSCHVAKKLFRSSYYQGERQFYSTKYLLLKYVLRQTTGSGKAPLDFPLLIRKTRREISEELGLSVKTINRVLRGFQESGLLDIVSGKIRISAEQYPVLRKQLHFYMGEKRNGSRE